MSFVKIPARLRTGFAFGRQPNDEPPDRLMAAMRWVQRGFLTSIETACRAEKETKPESIRSWRLSRKRSASATS